MDTIKAEHITNTISISECTSEKIHIKPEMDTKNGNDFCNNTHLGSGTNSAETIDNNQKIVIKNENIDKEDEIIDAHDVETLFIKSELNEDVEDVSAFCETVVNEETVYDNSITACNTDNYSGIDTENIVIVNASESKHEDAKLMDISVSSETVINNRGMAIF